jgi:hypothetical protein
MRPAVRDIQPRELAEGLAALAQHIGEQDGEVVAILRRAQRDLETLAWNRYAAHHNRLGERRDFIRRHRLGLPASRWHTRKG